MNQVQENSEHRSQKSSTAERHHDLQDRLIAAAETAIASTGLETVRARSLAEAVGCSVGAIYQVFPDLDALVLAVNGQTLDAIDAVMRHAVPAGTPAERFGQLAETYLTYAAEHRLRWAALFQHRMPGGRPVPAEYAAKQVAAFGHIEQPLAALRPDLDAEQRALLARTLFAAVHGMVELGLDEKVAAMPLALLREQVGLVVAAIARGLQPG